MSIDGREGGRVGRRRRLLALAACLLAVVELAGCAAFRGAKAYQRGSDALARGDAVTAIAELERAAAWVPHASEIENHLGIAYAMDARPEAALAAFRRAVEIDCDNQAAQKNLAEAEVYQAAGRARSSEEGAPP